jgi:hypothetical protein
MMKFRWSLPGVGQRFSQGFLERFGAEILADDLAVPIQGTRLAALALAVFTLLAAVLFHRAPDQMQQILFMKNLAIAGGMLILTARGAGTWSLDGRAAGLRAPGDVIRRS